MKISKIIKKIFAISIIFAFISLSSLFLVKTIAAPSPTPSTSVGIVIEGASIRTVGNPGLRFKVNISNFTEFSKDKISEYGIRIAFGECNSVDSLINDNVINGYSVLENTITELDDKENGIYYMTLYGIPETDYLQDVTAIAFVVNGESNQHYYSQTPITRNIGEIALHAANDGYLEIDNLVGEVVNYLSNNYKKYYTDEMRNVHIEDLAYETNPKKLYIQFAKDWNSFSNKKLNVNAKGNDIVIEINKSLSTISGFSEDYDIVKFFNDEVMKDKWGWLLDMFKNGPDKSQRIINQINAINGTATEKEKESWYNCLELTSKISGFFTYSNIYTESYNDSFKNYPQFYGEIVKYNKSIYTSLTDEIIFEIGKKINLPFVEEKNGYTFSWNEEYDSGEEYTVSMDNEILVQNYTPIYYNASFYLVEGEVQTKVAEINDISSNDEPFEMPNIFKDGYRIYNWCTDPELKIRVSTFDPSLYSADVNFYSSKDNKNSLMFKVGDIIYGTLEEAVRESNGKSIYIEPYGEGRNNIIDLEIDNTITIDKAVEICGDINLILRYRNDKTLFNVTNNGSLKLLDFYIDCGTRFERTKNGLESSLDKVYDYYREYNDNSTNLYRTQNLINVSGNGYLQILNGSITGFATKTSGVSVINASGIAPASGVKNALNVILNNVTLESNLGLSGTIIDLEQYADAIVKDCIIKNNVSYLNSNHGLFKIYIYSNLVISNSLIDGNSYNGNGGIVGLYDNSSLEINSSTITNNYGGAFYKGLYSNKDRCNNSRCGMIYLHTTSKAIIDNADIYDNTIYSTRSSFTFEYKENPFTGKIEKYAHVYGFVDILDGSVNLNNVALTVNNCTYHDNYYEYLDGVKKEVFATGQLSELDNDYNFNWVSIDGEAGKGIIDNDYIILEIN